MNRIDGKIALITGGTQGLGAAIARLFVTAGAAGIAIVGRDQAKGAALAHQITQDSGVPVQMIAADLAEIDQVMGVVPQTVAQFGKIDILVNAAGLTDRGNLLNTSPELFDKIFAVNVRAPFFLMQEAVKHMAAGTGDGRIVNIGSVNAWCGERNLLAYSISKGALLTLTRNLGDSLGPMGIRVNQINPGWVLTENEIKIKRAEGMPDDWPKRLPVTTAPSGSLIDPDELAATVCFFLSDLAPRVSGTIMDYEQYPVIGRNPPKVTV